MNDQYISSESFKLIIKILEKETSDTDGQWYKIENQLKDNIFANDILKWLFNDYENKVGYVWIRVHAGLEFLKREPLQGWSQIEKLVRSNDPDDRDTRG